MRFTIDEYAKAYSISHEMVQSRLRRNRLNYIVEDETTFIVVPKHQVPHHVEDTSLTKKTTVATVIGLYQKENHYLKLKIEELEAKVDALVSDKEQLLKDECKRVEKIYADKDVQLKTILELINTKLLQDASPHKELDAPTQTLNVLKTNQTPTELKEYLRSLDLKSNVRKTIKRRFAEAFGEDPRVQLKNGKFHLDFEKYDYSDLLKIK